MPDTVIPGTPGTPSTVIPGTAGTPAVPCPGPPVVASNPKPQSYRKPFQIASPLRVSNTLLAAGSYQFAWNGSGPSAQVEVLENGSTVARVRARRPIERGIALGRDRHEPQCGWIAVSRIAPVRRREAGVILRSRRRIMRYSMARAVLPLLQNAESSLRTYEMRGVHANSCCGCTSRGLDALRTRTFFASRGASSFNPRRCAKRSSDRNNHHSCRNSNPACAGQPD